MGRHADDDRGRGLAGWLVGAIISALLLIAAVIGYIVVLNRADSTGQGVCQSDVTLSIVAGPGAAPALAEAAGAYNKTKPVVRSACINAVVSTSPDDAVLTGLTGHWPIKELPAPGMWVPDSAASLSALDAVRPDLAAGHATDPFAWSPVVLAMSGPDAAAVGSLSWTDLATSAGAGGTAALPNGRHLILALPPIANARASSYALQSVITGANVSNAVDPSTVEASAKLLRTIDSAHGGQAATTGAALTALANPDSANAADAETVSAVPVVEADLVRFNRQSLGNPLTAVHPDGTTVGDALIAAPISGTWTGRTIVAAGSDFQAFLTSVAGQQILADNGWRTTSAHPADPQPEVDIQAKVTMVPAGGPSVDQALAVALGQSVAPSTTATTETTAPVTTSSSTPPVTTETTTTETTTTATETTPSTPDAAAQGPVLTVIVDVSAGMATEDEGDTLLNWVTKALPSLFDGTLTDRVGLWVYSDGAIYPPTGSPELVPTGPLTEEAEVPKLGPDGAVTETVKELRSKALSEAIAGLTTADSERWAYGALMEALPKAAEAAVDGRANRVLLITSGVDETPGTLRVQVLDAVREVAGTVRLDVVGLGESVPVAAYTDIAAAGGGEYIPATDPANLAQQLRDFLTLGD